MAKKVLIVIMKTIKEFIISILKTLKEFIISIHYLSKNSLLEALENILDIFIQVRRERILKEIERRVKRDVIDET